MAVGQRNSELGDFLRTRRSRLEPADVGLPGTTRRRVHGLRREELAQAVDPHPSYGNPSAAGAGPDHTLHWILTRPTARALYAAAWEDSATEMIGKLRIETGQLPRNPRARELVAQLDEASPLFRRVWRQHEVSSCVQGDVKVFHHRLGGALPLRADAVTVHSAPGQVCYVLLPVDDSFDRAFRRYSVQVPS